MYLCTGNHNWSHPQFTLIPAPIKIEAGSWVAARAVVGPGVAVSAGSVFTLGSTAGKLLEPMMIYAGNPAMPIKSLQMFAELPQEG